MELPCTYPALQLFEAFKKAIGVYAEALRGRPVQHTDPAVFNTCGHNHSDDNPYSIQVSTYIYM